MRSKIAFALLVALVSSGCGGATAPEDQGTNVLLITLDTVRADRLGSYGHATQTLALDRLAAEGIRFERATAPAPTTLPSHATLFTGLAPPSHGVRDNAANGLADSAVTLAETLQAAGHRTGAFVGAYVLDARRGLAQGFEVYSGVPVIGAGPTRAEDAERRGDVVVESALPWLRQQQGQWFAWVHLFDAHAPYAAPEPFGSRGADPYDGEILWLDAIIDGLRRQLVEAGQWEHTTVIVTADHGESLGEHGEATHGFFIYEATTRVPLIIRPADSLQDAGFQRGSTVTTGVGLIDLFPTIAELQGVTPPAGLQGRSLVPALRGEALDDVPVYSETLYPLLQFGWSDLRGITVGNDKLIEAPRPELFDLSTDPGELDNLAVGSDRQIQELREAMAPWVEPDLTGDATAGVTTDPEQLASLRALGYVAVARASGGGDLADPKDKIETFERITTAMGLMRAGETPQALELIDALIADEPDFAGAHHFRGLVLSGAGDNEGAAASFERAMEIDPEHGIAPRALVRTYLALQRTDDAEALLGDLVEASPADVELRAELAALMTQQGRIDDAQQLVDAGLALNADAARLHMISGQLSLQRQQPEAALAAFDRVAALQPGNFAAHMNRALILSQLGRSDELVSTLEAALEARPGAPQAMLFLAQALLESGNDEDLERARELAEGGLARATNPQVRALGHTTLAEIYAALGRDEDADEQRREAQRAVGGR